MTEGTPQPRPKPPQWDTLLPELFRRLRARPDDIPTRNAIVEASLPLVNRVAHNLYLHLPRSVDPFALRSAGVLGLFDAVKSYDPDRGIKFTTHARWRIHGAMLDDVRRNDWIPRGERRKVALRAQAEERLICRTGRPPSAEEISREAGSSAEEHRQFALHGGPKNLLSIHSSDILEGDIFDSKARSKIIAEWMPDHREILPDEAFRRAEFWRRAVLGLNPFERRAIEMYFREGITMKAIGKVLGLSESRISNMISDALARLRETRPDLKEFAAGG